MTKSRCGFADPLIRAYSHAHAFYPRVRFLRYKLIIVYIIKHGRLVDPVECIQSLSELLQPNFINHPPIGTHLRI